MILAVAVATLSTQVYNELARSPTNGTRRESTARWKESTAVGAFAALVVLMLYIADHLEAHPGFLLIVAVLGPLAAAA